MVLFRIEHFLYILEKFQDQEYFGDNNNTLKRYQGDDGKITNFHFLMNADNLKPVLREMDPKRFI